MTDRAALAMPQDHGARTALSDSIREGFAAKAEERRQRQEAAGIPTSTPVASRTAAQEVERLGKRLAELGQ